jgi:hypothetical protein
MGQGSISGTLGKMPVEEDATNPLAGERWQSIFGTLRLGFTEGRLGGSARTRVSRY